MKIGITCYPTIGGSGVVATELGHQLASRGHEVHFITYAIPFRLRLEEDNVFFHEVEINQYDLFRYPDYALALAVKMASVCACHQLDILHVHYAIPHATSAFLAMQILEEQKKPKVVTTLHGTDITLVGSDPAYFDIVKFSMEKSDGLTAVSASLRERTLMSFNLKREIEVIYNFFDQDRDVVPIRRDEYAAPNEKVIIHASNFRAVKRPHDVIEIFSRIKRKIPAKLLLVGTGDGISSLRRVVCDYGLEGSVCFLGKSRTIDAYLTAADLFLLPSEEESFGLVALEAMAYGVPVIASKAGGLPELVTEGGFLEAPGDVEAMAARALELLTSKPLYQTVSAQAKMRAHTHFSAQKIVPRYEEYYRSLM